MRNNGIENPASGGIGMPGRLGNVIYWTCTGLAILMAAFGIWALTIIRPQYAGYADGFKIAVGAVVGSVMLYVFGRAARYVLVGR